MIAIFGGTFDPIHYGHLNAAWQVYQQVKGIKTIQFVVNQQPPHKEHSQSSAQHRAAMVKLAIKDVPEFAFNDIELQQEGPSYTIDTLKQLREQSPDEIINLIIGEDSYQNFHQWYRWQEILQLCNLIVVRRPNVDHGLNHQLHATEITDPCQLINSKNGGVLPLGLPELAISATEIRQQIKLGQKPRFLLPNSVIDYIMCHQLYEKSS